MRKPVLIVASIATAALVVMAVLLFNVSSSKSDIAEQAAEAERENQALEREVADLQTQISDLEAQVAASQQAGAAEGKVIEACLEALRFATDAYNLSTDAYNAWLDFKDLMAEAVILLTDGDPESAALPLSDANEVADDAQGFGDEAERAAADWTEAEIGCVGT